MPRSLSSSVPMAYTSPPKDDSPLSYLPPNSSTRSYDRPSSHLSPNSSNRLYFTDQAIRLGYGVPVDSREVEFQRYPRDLRDPVQREIEKDQIRAQIMAEQMERRRILEEEVRMELMVEREMTLQRWESSRMRLDAPPENREFVHEPSWRPRFDARSEIHESLHEPSRPRFDSPETRQYVHDEPSRISQPGLPLLPMVPSHPVVGLGIFGSLPFQHHPMPPTTSNLSLHEIKPFPEPRNERIVGSSPFRLHRPATSNSVLREIKPFPEPRKEKSYMAKNESNVSDLNRKRKASTLGADHHRTSNLEKKPKGGWSCKLCNISTTSEKTLIDHFKGKKHKLMEEEKGLAPHKTSFNSNPVMKKEFTLNSDKHKPGPSHPNVTKTTKTHKSKSSETPCADVAMVDKKQKSKMDETSRVEVAVADKMQNPRTTVKIREHGPATTPGNTGSVKKNRFWCELCQVGVNSEVVLAGHERGRRHLENLEEKKRKMKR